MGFCTNLFSGIPIFWNVDSGMRLIDAPPSKNARLNSPPLTVAVTYRGLLWGKGTRLSASVKVVELALSLIVRDTEPSADMHLSCSSVAMSIRAFVIWRRVDWEKPKASKNTLNFV